MRSITCAVSTMSLARKARLLLGLSIVLSACGGGGEGSPKTPTQPVVPTPVLTSVIVSLAAPSVQVGWTDSATAAGFDQTGAPFAIGAPVWSSDSSAIATVDPTGMIIGVALGQTTVIATVGGKQGQAVLPVVPVAVRTVTVDPSADNPSPGQTIQLTATTLDGVGDTLTGRVVRWSSTRPAVATVSPTGLVTAIRGGTTIIVATSEYGTGASTITVTGPIAPGVVVTIGTPVPGQIVGDTLAVHAVATSSYPITGAVATVGSRQIPLTRIFIGASGVIEAWVGTMNLSGTFYGTEQVLVTATDSQNTFGIDSVSFVRKKLVLGGSSPAPRLKQVVPAVPIKAP
jgi:hypothetical protein